MCLVTEIKTPFVADGDMVVYKILNQDLESVCQGFQYEYDTIYRTKFKVVDVENQHISLADDNAVNYYGCKTLGWKIPDCIRVSKGFHSYATLDRALPQLDTCELEIIVQCTIPKGATYYKDSTGLIVSNKLRVDKIVEHE